MRKSKRSSFMTNPTQSTVLDRAKQKMIEAISWVSIDRREEAALEVLTTAVQEAVRGMVEAVPIPKYKPDSGLKMLCVNHNQQFCTTCYTQAAARAALLTKSSDEGVDVSK